MRSRLSSLVLKFDLPVRQMASGIFYFFFLLHPVGLCMIFVWVTGNNINIILLNLTLESAAPVIFWFWFFIDKKLSAAAPVQHLCLVRQTDDTDGRWRYLISADSGLSHWKHWSIWTIFCNFWIYVHYLDAIISTLVNSISKMPSYFQICQQWQCSKIITVHCLFLFYLTSCIFGGGL